MNICIAIIHGIGRQDKTYADGFIKLISDGYYKKTKKQNLNFEAICWQGIIEPLETSLFHKLPKLGWKRVRNLFIGFAGDAICYQPSYHPTDNVSTYDQVNLCVDDCIKKLQKDNPNSPLCIISHSLGTIVASNFIKEVHKNTFKISALSKDMTNNNLELFYTIGSPLAIWSLRYDNGGNPLNIQPPAKWYNIYSNNDVIGYPVKIINDNYTSIDNIFDVKINVGGWLTKWNPLSHNEYWSSKKIINHIVSNLIEVDKYYTTLEQNK